MSKLWQWIERVTGRAESAQPQVEAQLPPSEPWADYELAKAMVQQQQWQAAIAACQRAIAIDPSCPWFYNTLAEAYLGQTSCQQAVEASQQAVALSPETSWLHHTLGKAYLGQEQWQQAAVACQQAIALDANISWFHYHLGEALVKSQQWQQSIPVLQRAIELNPEFAWAYYCLGEALLADQQIDAAIQVYQQGRQLHPEIEQFQHCLNYAQHLRIQEQQIADYVQKAQNSIRSHENERLRVLMLTPYPTYPPKLGAVTRMFHEMQIWGERHELVVLSFIFMPQDYCLEDKIASYCELGLTVMIGDALPRTSQQPQLIHRYSSQRLRRLLTLLQPAQFDIVLCDFIYTAQYIDLFPDAYHVLAEHNIESQLLQRSATINRDKTQLDQLAQQRAAVKAFVDSEQEADLLAAFEDNYWSEFQLRTVVSEQDQQTMQQRCTSGKTIVVNNGIDTKNITLIAPAQNQTILFIGTMSYYPNIDAVDYFAAQILPLIWQRQPAVSFWIAGAEPPEAILDLAQEPRIKVISNPEDMSAVAQNCCLTVVPLRIGSGTRIKILHSLALGLPVVTTSLGCEGLAVEDGVHLLIRDQPEAFADRVLELLGNSEMRQQLCQNGRALVEQYYDWRQIFEAAEAKIVAEFKSWQAKYSATMPDYALPD